MIPFYPSDGTLTTLVIMRINAHAYGPCVNTKPTDL